MRKAARLFIFRLVPLLLLSSCNLTFWGSGWSGAVYGAPELDRQLIFRQERLRKAQRNGAIHSEGGLYYAEGGCKVHMEVVDGDMILTFFGTETVEDVYYDIVPHPVAPWPDSAPDIKVHAGFYYPYAALSESIQGAVQDFRDGGGNSLLVTGHSAGGCHAAISALDLALKNPGLSLYVQIGGAPAVGNRAFAAALELTGEVHRYLNGSDMMPSLLTPSMGFVHAGDPYRIGPPADPFFAASGLWVTHHFIEDYAESLRQGLY